MNDDDQAKEFRPHYPPSRYPRIEDPGVSSSQPIAALAVFIWLVVMLVISAVCYGVVRLFHLALC